MALMWCLRTDKSQTIVTQYSSYGGIPFERSLYRRWNRVFTLYHANNYMSLDVIAPNTAKETESATEYGQCCAALNRDGKSSL